MEDLKTLLYIFFAIIYFMVRIVGKRLKKKPQATNTQSSEIQPNATQYKGEVVESSNRSFETLLKEITGESQEVSSSFEEKKPAVMEKKVDDPFFKQKTAKKTHKVERLFNGKSDLKKAVIMAEVLNKRY